MLLSRLILSFSYCVLFGNWVLDGREDYFVCTTNWFAQISLKFWKWLVYKDFILKGTNFFYSYYDHLRNNLHFFIGSNSVLIFSTCSILSTTTDLPVCIDLVF